MERVSVIPISSAIAVFLAILRDYTLGMGRVELGAQKKRRNRNIQRAVLMTVGAAGLIAVMAVAPNALQLLKTTGINARLRYKAKTVLGKLKQKGEIEFIERDGRKYARLTERGRQIFALTSEKMRIADIRQKKWDRRYRLIIFDVPEKRKKIRERLRHEMKQSGFLRIQDSAWLYPHDCEEYIALLKANLHIGKDVLYAVVEQIENDVWIRKQLNLPIN